MTNTGSAHVAVISDEDELVILAVGVSLLVVIMAVIVGGCLFLRRRRRTPCWRGGLFKRRKPEHVLPTGVRQAYISYPTWPCNPVMAKGQSRLPLPPRYAPPPGRERGEANCSPCVAAPTSTSEQHSRPVHTEEQTGRASEITQPSTFHQRPLSIIYRTYGPSLAWASHQSCRNAAGTADAWEPRVPHTSASTSSQPRISVTPFLTNSWPRQPSHGSAEALSNSQPAAEPEHAGTGAENINNGVAVCDTVAPGSIRHTPHSIAYVRQMSFPPASRPPPLRAELSRGRVATDAARATPEQQQYDRGDLFKTIQLLRAKNDWVRHNRLARLRSPDDSFAGGSRHRRDTAAVHHAPIRPVHYRCFSAPSAYSDGDRRLFATANSAAPLPRTPPQEESPDPKGPRPAELRGPFPAAAAVRQRTPPAAASAPHRCTGCCGPPSARGGVVVYPRRVAAGRPCVHEAAGAAASGRTREAIAAGAGGCTPRSAAAVQHAQSSSTSGGGTAARTSTPIASSGDGGPSRRAPLQPRLKLLDALKLRSCEAPPRSADEDPLSSEPPSSLCDVSLNSSLTPELSAARGRRLPSNDAGGSTSVDDKYEFDLQTPG